MSKVPGMPPHISCPECKKEGKHVLHMVYSMGLSDGKWSWELLNHDTTSKFRWPEDFESREAAKAHITGILDSAAKGDAVV